MRTGSDFLPPKTDDNDNCPVDPNPLQENNDGDSLGDACDNCPLVDNEAQTNTDADLEGAGASVVGDSLGDACDDDDDNDGFDDGVETYVGTVTLDNCPAWAGTPGLCPGPGCDGDDAWPLDINVDRVITASFDVLPYRGRLQAEPGDDNWLQRLDLNMDSVITASFDVLPFRGMLQQTCT